MSVAYLKGHTRRGMAAILYELSGPEWNVHKYSQANGNRITQIEGCLACAEIAAEALTSFHNTVDRTNLSKVLTKGSDITVYMQHEPQVRHN